MQELWLPKAESLLASITWSSLGGLTPLGSLVKEANPIAESGMQRDENVCLLSSRVFLYSH